MIRVLIVDNFPLSGEKFSLVINEQSDIDVIANIASASQALNLINAADVVLIGTSLDDDGAYWLTQRIALQGDRARTLIVGQSETNKAIIQYIEAGAQGFIRRKDPLLELPEKIRLIARGEVILSPDLVADVVARLAELAYYIESAQFSSQIACLTPREREVLQLIARNYSNRDIANQLIIEIGTVKNHVHNILSKLNVSSRREAARYLPSIISDAGVNLYFPLRILSTT